MDPRIEELSALRALTRTINKILVESRKELFRDSLPGQRAVRRIEESLIDCLRKGSVDLGGILIAVTKADLAWCEQKLAQRMKEFGLEPESATEPSVAATRRTTALDAACPPFHSGAGNLCSRPSG